MVGGVSAYGMDQQRVAFAADLCAMAFSERGQAIKNALRLHACSQYRPSAFGAARAKAQIDRVQRHACQRALLEDNRRHGAFPELGFGRKAAGVLVSAGVQEVSRCCLVAKAEAPIGFRGKLLHRVVLKYEVAQTVEDRTTPVDLCTKCQVRAVAGDDVSAGIHGRAGELDSKGSGVLQAGIARGVPAAAITKLVRVKAEDQPVALAASLGNGTQIGIGIRAARACAHGKALGTLELLTEHGDAIRRFLAKLTGAVELPAVASAFLRQAQPLADAGQCSEGFSVDFVGGAEAQRVDAGPTTHIRALVTGHVPGSEE